jgi:hypothetical protein
LPAPKNPAVRSHKASAAVLESWARTPDRAARTQPARDAMQQKYLERARELAPEGASAEDIACRLSPQGRHAPACARLSEGPRRPQGRSPGGGVMDAPRHTHPELEDRISAEMSGVQTEIVALRSDTRRGFADVVQALQNHGEHLRQQGETLREILEHLGRQNGGSDG